MMIWFLLRDDANVNGWQSGLDHRGGQEEAVVHRVPMRLRSSAAPAVGEQLAVQRVDVVDEALDAVARE